MLARHRSAALGLLALTLLAGIDILGNVHVFPGVVFVVVPLAVALRANARDTAVVAAVAVPVVIAVAFASDTGTTARWIVSVTGVAAGGLLAVWLAELRVR